MAFVARQKQLRAVCLRPAADYHQRQEKIFDPVLKLRATATDTVIQSYYSNDYHGGQDTGEFSRA